MAKSLIKLGACLYTIFTGSLMALAVGFIIAETLEIVEKVTNNMKSK